MAAKTLSREEHKKMAMIDLAHEILKTEKQPLPFQNIVDRIKDMRPISKGDYEEHVARLYANMNLDGRFLSIGEAHWGLRGWYPFDQKEDDIEVPKPKRKRKRKKKVEEEPEEQLEEDEEEVDLSDEDYDEDYDDEDDEEEDEDETEEDDDTKKSKK